MLRRVSSSTNWEPPSWISRNFPQFGMRDRKQLFVMFCCSAGSHAERRRLFIRNILRSVHWARQAMELSSDRWHSDRSISLRRGDISCESIFSLSTPLLLSLSNSLRRRLYGSIPSILSSVRVLICLINS